ncbi:MAG: hypothetical protein JO316_10130 [Abitibacteriaceae bacterium]|nr:hypothetical protein [Abditibacteriaceae bacterium]
MDNKSKGRRIHNLDELTELWPAVRDHIQKRLGSKALAYIYYANPVAFDEEEVVLQFAKKFHLKMAVEASKRLPFEQVVNECLASPHRLRFQFSAQPEV